MHIQSIGPSPPTCIAVDNELLSFLSNGMICGVVNEYISSLGLHVGIYMPVSDIPAGRDIPAGLYIAFMLPICTYVGMT